MSGFDKSMPTDITKEFENREKFIADKSIKWNYDKYCWITMEATGNSSTVLCPTAHSAIGDTSAARVKHIDLYETEGGVRKFKPQLKSVKIDNQGAQDYTDAFIYEVEASFSVFTQSQLNKVNDSFFKAGSEILFKFGWEGYSSGVNKGEVKANVYNFSFSMVEDGSFDCTIKCMSAAGLWAGDDMGGTTKSTSDDDEGDKYSDFLKTLKTDMRAAFGLKAAADVDEVDDIGNNALVGKVHTRAKYSSDATFYAAEIVVEPGFGDVEKYVSFCSIKTFLDYVNYKTEQEGLNITKYQVATPSDGELGKWPVGDHSHIGSADPSKFVLPGAQGCYGKPGSASWSDGNIDKNFAKWGDIINQTAPSNQSLLEKTIVSIEYMDEVYKKLNDAAGRKNGIKVAPKISEFISELFGTLESLTGGLIQTGLIPFTNGGELLDTTNQEISLGNPLLLKLCNKKMVSSPAEAKKPEPYVFKTLSKGAMCRGVSLSTDMDSDTMLMMAPTNVGKGTSNMANAEKLDGGSSCGKADDSIKATSADNPEPSEIEEIRKEYGNKGFDGTKISSLSEMMKNSILRNPSTKGRYSEVIFAYDLSVTIDGIWGIPFMAPISIDRLPSVYKTTDGIIFSITGVSHSFDGKGDWETSLSTVMRIV